MAKLVECRNQAGQLYGYAHWCPGCQHAHIFHTVRIDSGPCWDFDGNLERPTFRPSMREFWPAHNGKPERTLCHYFLRNGEIDFLGDSTEHELRGKVPLPDFPEDYRVG